VAIIGAGALGSHLAWALARLGIRRMKVFDDDFVEWHNLATQTYEADDALLGKAKVCALAEHIHRALGDSVEFEVFPQKVVSRRLTETYVCLAVDTMAARRNIWENSFRGEAKTHLLIDGRLGLESGHVYAINPRNDADCKFYEQSLYTDDEAAPRVCGEEVVIPTVYLVAGLMAACLLNHILGLDVPRAQVVSTRPFLLQAMH
jgi:molybdopterin/thiamine biosynthesis adenylyltransferase